jgi:hypothetical protein
VLSVEIPTGNAGRLLPADTSDFPILLRRPLPAILPPSNRVGKNCLRYARKTGKSFLSSTGRRGPAFPVSLIRKAPVSSLFFARQLVKNSCRTQKTDARHL